MTKIFSNDSQKLATAYALLAVFCWSTIATVFKMALSSTSIVIVLFISTITSFLLYFIVVLKKNNFSLKVFLKIKLNELIKSAYLGLLNPVCYYLVLFNAYSILPAHIAQPLNYTWPFVLTVFSSFILKEKFNVNSIISILICIIGITFLSLSAQKYNSENCWYGVILATSSSIVWALYWILNKKDGREVINKLFLNFFFASIYTTLIIISTEPHFYKSLTIKAFFLSVYIGLFEMGVTFILWLKALELSTRSDKISIYIYLSPVISLIFINFILKETFNIFSLLGIVLIFAGILKLNYKILKTIICPKKA
ncbi:MAG: DMT family transporter [Bacteroidales bacterium]|nr:DMT family transporter [Bacteroidales bacterium]